MWVSVRPSLTQERHPQPPLWGRPVRRHWLFLQVHVPGGTQDQPGKTQGSGLLVGHAASAGTAPNSRPGPRAPSLSPLPHWWEEPQRPQRLPGTRAATHTSARLLPVRQRQGEAGGSWQGRARGADGQGGRGPGWRPERQLPPEGAALGPQAAWGRRPEQASSRDRSTPKRHLRGGRDRNTRAPRGGCRAGRVPHIGSIPQTVSCLLRPSRRVPKRP